MGDILVGYFAKAKEKRGLEGQIKLAMLTKMSGQKAQAAEDSTENIAIFEKALSQI